MTAVSIKTIVCECGQYLVIYQPGNKEVIEKMREMLEPKFYFIELGSTQAQCPQCGKAYLLPPDETFDLDRSSFGQSLSKMADGLESKHEPPEPGAGE